MNNVKEFVEDAINPKEVLGKEVLKKDVNPQELVDTMVLGLFMDFENLGIEVMIRDVIKDRLPEEEYNEIKEHLNSIINIVITNICK